MMVRVWTTTGEDWPESIGVPEIDGIPPIEILQAGRETPATESTAASGRYYVEHWFTAPQLDWLAAQDGVHITAAGTFDALEWPFPTDS